MSVVAEKARKLTVPHLLTFNGGYVDTAGFLALQGLFTAHVTGNFVTIGAALAHGTSGVIAKLLALPLFCIVVAAVRYFTQARVTSSALERLLSIKLLLFGIAAVLALKLGPFSNGDSLPAIVAGMTLVAAMAIQNAVHRIHFPRSPPTTLMTGSTTQVMMDFADLVRPGAPPEQRATARTRAASLATSVCIFAVGCAIAALIYVAARHQGHEGAVFVLPVLVAATSLVLRSRDPEV